MPRKKSIVWADLAEGARILETAGMNYFLESTWPYDQRAIDVAQTRALELLAPMYEGKRVVKVDFRLYWDHVDVYVRSGGRQVRCRWGLR